jgi:hypothetical protein
MLTPQSLKKLTKNFATPDSPFTGTQSALAQFEKTNQTSCSKTTPARPDAEPGGVE